RASLKQKLDNLGFNIKLEEIISAPQAAKLYLQHINNPNCYLLLADDVKQDFNEFKQSIDDANYIIIGDIGDAWSYQILNQIFNRLINGAELIAVHKSRFWQTEQGLQMDIGGFISALEYASGKNAIIIGKPSPHFFQMALDDMSLNANEVAIIGDDIDSDIGGGQAIGLTGILVKTGKYREDYAANSKINPDFIFNSVADLMNHET
ncbi:partial D-glycero-D-manno-heptose 1,7-bisphosphate phosphatase, partial [Patescibacteria group bacterium]